MIVPGCWSMGLGTGRPGDQGGTVSSRRRSEDERPAMHTQMVTQMSSWRHQPHLHPWKKARMWVALKLTLLIPKDRQIIKIKQGVQNESTTKLASSRPTPWQTDGHQQLEGLTCEKETKGLGIRIPSRRTNRRCINRSRGCHSPGLPWFLPLLSNQVTPGLGYFTENNRDAIHSFCQSLEASIMPGVMVSSTPQLSFSILDIVITILYWHPARAIVINSMFHPLLEQKFRMFKKKMTALLSSFLGQWTI